VTRAVTGDFLSDDWFIALGERLSGLRSPAGGDSGVFRIGQLVLDAPAGLHSSWVIVLQPGLAPLLVLDGDLESADAVLVASYQAAKELDDGNESAHDLFRTGRLKLRGDIARFVAGLELLGTGSISS
jgi:hypothetical protein